MDQVSIFFVKLAHFKLFALTQNVRLRHVDSNDESQTVAVVDTPREYPVRQTPTRRREQIGYEAAGGRSTNSLASCYAHPQNHELPVRTGKSLKN